MSNPLEGLSVRALKDPGPKKLNPLEGLSIRAAEGNETEEFEGPGEIESAARGLAQGATLGFSDEITAGFESAFTDKTYEQSVKEARDANKRASERNEKSYFLGEMAGGVALTFAPGFGWMAKGAKGIVGSGAVAGAGYADEDDLTTSVATGAALGGAFAGAGKLLRQATRRRPLDDNGNTMAMGWIKSLGANLGLTKAIVNIHRTDKEFAANVLQRVEMEIKKGLPEVPPPGQLSDDFIRFDSTKSITSKVTKDMRQATEAKFGTGIPADTWENFQRYKISTRIGREKLDDRMSEAIGEKGGNNYFRTATQNSDIIDDRWGTNLAGDIVNASVKATHETNILLFDPITKMRATDKLAKKAFGKDQTLLIQALNSPKGAVKLNKAQQEVADTFRDLHETSLKLLNSQGGRVRRKENWVPKMAMDRDGIYALLRNRLRGGGINSGNWKADNQIAKEFRETLQYINGGKPVRKWKAALSKIEDLNDPKSKFVTPTGVSKSLSTELEQKGTVPKHLLATSNDSYGIVLAKHLTSNLTALKMRDPIQKVSSNLGFFRGVGDKEAVKFLEEYSRVLTGGSRSKFSAFANNAYAEVKLRASQLQSSESRLAQKAGDWLEDVPEAMRWMGSSIYPNMLGWRLDAPLRNLTQPWAMGATDFEAKAGMKITLNAYAEARKELKGGKKSIMQFLKSKGLLVDHLDPEGMKGHPQHAVFQGLDKLNKQAMRFYTWTDGANRIVSWNVGQQVGRELAKDQPAEWAEKWLRKQPGGIRSKVKLMKELKDSENLNDAVSRHIVSRHQFDYSKKNTSQFMRDFGQVVSMFSRWPVENLGNVAYQYKRKGLSGGSVEAFKRYGAVFAMAMGIDKAMETADLEDNSMKKLLIGKSLTNWTPAKSLSISSPPLLNLATGDWDEKWRTAKAFTPIGMLETIHRKNIKPFTE